MRSDGRLTDDEYTFIDEEMARLGWLYNPQNDDFEATLGSEAGKVIFWRDMIEAIPSAGLGRLQAFCRRKKSEFGING